ncbi:hypothetical protein FM038_017310 [Shewanella eurypsychrophilus]|uniref:Uncharacterized protein n=1 Tax=Shewanella eurypsychrophilus TaxID=2593656 RepID=A0ABX6VAR3_9GAMM|nr:MULTISPECIES: hypothetical protein [Shewanella]QFU23756.1 hypothetical protein FS418_19090 [Shewanella sp. YLB-09]QPG58979.1 hypothetical protein FM038_017310 [Shewanella eurypsychrophilus]
MDDKDVDSCVDELMAKGMDNKLNGMLSESGDDILDAVLASRDSMLSQKSENPSINKVFVKSEDSHHVEQNPSIVVNNHVSYVPPYHPEPSYPTQSNHPYYGPKQSPATAFNPKPSIAPGQRETDECLTGPQCSELHECLEQIMVLAKPLNTDMTKPKLWSGVSDFCDVPKNIVPPRYKSISQNNFHKALYFLNKKKCELLTLQLDLSQAEEIKAKQDLKSHLRSIDIAETEAVVIANEDLQQRDKELVEVNQKLEIADRSVKVLTTHVHKLEKEHQLKVEAYKDTQAKTNQSLKEAKQYALVGVFTFAAIVSALGWFRYF